MDPGQRLTLDVLMRLPPSAILSDIQAFYAYGGRWGPWTRWPRATPAEIMAGMRLQRRFAPVLKWRCAGIDMPIPNPAR